MGKVRIGKYEIEVFQDEYADSPRKEYDNLSTMYCWHKRYSLGDSNDRPDEILRGLLNNLKFDDMKKKVDENVDVKIETDKDNEGCLWYTSYVNGEKFTTCSSVEDTYDDIVCEIGDLLDHMETRDFISKLVPVMRTLHLYDHSGISISGSSFHGRAPHASWDSGVVGIAIVTHEKLKEEGVTAEQAGEYIDGEIETYDLYLRGEVYGIGVYEVEVCGCCGHEEINMIDSCHGFYRNERMAEDMAEGFRFEDVDDCVVVEAIKEAIGC